MTGYKLIYESPSGGSVWLHPWHGQDELSQNESACRILADHGYKADLLPAIPENEKEMRFRLLPDVEGFKNPDVRIKGVGIGDIKTPAKMSVIHKGMINRYIHSCAVQKVQVAIMNLAERDYAVQDIKKGIIGALQPDRNKTIKEVWVITSRRKLFIVKREMVFDESIYNSLDML